MSKTFGLDSLSAEAKGQGFHTVSLLSTGGPNLVWLVVSPPLDSPFHPSCSVPVRGSASSPTFVRFLDIPDCPINRRSAVGIGVETLIECYQRKIDGDRLR